MDSAAQNAAWTCSRDIPEKMQKMKQNANCFEQSLAFCEFTLMNIFLLLSQQRKVSDSCNYVTIKRTNSSAGAQSLCRGNFVPFCFLSVSISSNVLRARWRVPLPSGSCQNLTETSIENVIFPGNGNRKKRSIILLADMWTCRFPREAKISQKTPGKQAIWNKDNQKFWEIFMLRQCMNTFDMEQLQKYLPDLDLCSQDGRLWPTCTFPRWLNPEAANFWAPFLLKTKMPKIWQDLIFSDFVTRVANYFCRWWWPSSGSSRWVLDFRLPSCSGWNRCP